MGQGHSSNNVRSAKPERRETPLTTPSSAHPANLNTHLSRALVDVRQGPKNNWQGHQQEAGKLVVGWEGRQVQPPAHTSMTQGAAHTAHIVLLQLQSPAVKLPSLLLL